MRPLCQNDKEAFLRTKNFQLPKKKEPSSSRKMNPVLSSSPDLYLCLKDLNIRRFAYRSPLTPQHRKVALKTVLNILLYFLWQLIQLVHYQGVDVNGNLSFWRDIEIYISWTEFLYLRVSPKRLEYPQRFLVKGNSCRRRFTFFVRQEFWNKSPEIGARLVRFRRLFEVVELLESGLFEFLAGRSSDPSSVFAGRYVVDTWFATK